MKKIEKICIIDDDPIHIYVTRDTIESAKICEEIIEFENGKIAYDSLAAMVRNGETLPNIILLDLNMPIWDGWDFLDEFSKIKFKEKLVVLITTSSNNQADERKAKKYSLVNNLIIKPISMEDLTRELQRY